MSKNYTIIISWLLIFQFCIGASNSFASKLDAEMMSTTVASENIIIITGASYAKGWAPSIIAGRTVINMGIDGAETSNILKWIKEEVITLKPESIVIWGFINSIFRSEGKSQLTVSEEIKSDFIKMIDLADTTDIKLILMTEITLPEPKGLVNNIKTFIGKLLGKNSYQSKINSQVQQINSWLLDLANTRGVLVLDIHKILATNIGDRKARYAQEDGSHISDLGYNEITRYIETQATIINLYLEKD